MNTQQEYLARAVDALRDEFLPATPSPLLVTYGWPSRKALSARRRTLGECWPARQAPAPYKAAIFISPVCWKAPADLLHVVLHEMIHTIVPGGGHRAPFSQIAGPVGLVKPWTATTPSPELAVKLEAIAATLGDFPSAGMEPAPKVKKGSRLRLFECQCAPPVKVRVAHDDFDARCNVCVADFEFKDS